MFKEAYINTNIFDFPSKWLALSVAEVLPLVDMFRNRELEFGCNLSSLKVLYSELSISEPNFGYA